VTLFDLADPRVAGTPSLIEPPATAGRRPFKAEECPCVRRLRVLDDTAVRADRIKRRCEAPAIITFDAADFG
jgi:hypothetical protein